MVVPGLLLLVSVCVFGFHHVEGKTETLSSVDSSYCHGGLEVRYPDVDITTCVIIPKEQKLRNKISTLWKAPNIYFSGADKRKTYVLMMVDPDAPNRANPTSAHWRHWLVVNIKGSDLKRGQLKGTTLTEYHPPSPPSKSGFHRYQFLLFEQPPGTTLSLTKPENSSRGKWDSQAFITKFGLGTPVATLQFLTQNYKD